MSPHRLLRHDHLARPPPPVDHVWHPGRRFSTRARLLKRRL